VTGTEELDRVTQVKLRVIARDVPLQHLSVHIPALRELISGRQLHLVVARSGLRPEESQDIESEQVRDRALGQHVGAGGRGGAARGG
jgi:hypothetical protein